MFLNQGTHKHENASNEHMLAVLHTGYTLAFSERFISLNPNIPNPFQMWSGCSQASLAVPSLVSTSGFLDTIPPFWRGKLRSGLQKQSLVYECFPWILLFSAVEDFRTKEMGELSPEDWKFPLGRESHVECDEECDNWGFPSGSSHPLDTLHKPLVPTLSKEIMRRIIFNY